MSKSQGSTLAVRQVPLLDLKAQHARLRDEVLVAITRLVDSQQFILGEEVAALEREIAADCGATRAVGCASGTDALYLALLALGIGPGDEVIVPPYTFFATAGAVVRAGATPVFADIEEDTYNLDMRRVAAALDAHPRVRAVIPVHLFGACADMDPLLELARDRGIFVIEDAAQAIGAEYKGRRAGSLAHVACFSFFPTKNLGAYGDAGMLTTNDEALADRLSILRVHGGKTKYHHDVIGINSRLDALQAAVLCVKLRYLDSWTAARQINAERYRGHLAEFAPQVTPQRTAASATRHVWNQFVVRAPGRDGLRTFLEERRIGCEIYYPVPLHLQPCFANLGYKKGDCPISEKLAEESLALPVYAELSEEDLLYVCRTMGEYYG